MNTQQNTLPVKLKRAHGGFRRLIETELGEEQLCCTCGEFWPMDKEFFIVRRIHPGYECKACIVERKLATIVSTEHGSLLAE